VARSERIRLIKNIIYEISKMTDVEVDNALSNFDLKIQPVRNKNQNDLVFISISMSERVIEPKPKYRIVDNNKESWIFGSKRSILEWCLAKSRGVFDNMHED
jgi:hypothetical protein